MIPPELHCYLDTTVFADAAFGSNHVRQQLKAILRNRRLLTSRYVREQFRGTFLRAATLLYNDLLETRSPFDTIQRTDDYRIFKSREGVKARKILVTLFRHEESDVDIKLLTLRRWILRDIMRRFHRDIEVIDDTFCCICSESVEQDAEGFFHIKSSCTLTNRRPCQIEEFWRKRRDFLCAIAKLDLSALPKAHDNPSIRKAKSASIAVTEQDEPPRGQRCWVDLSDAIIVCESPERCVLLTTNVKDFEPLARAIGGGRVVFDYTAQ